MFVFSAATAAPVRPFRAQYEKAAAREINAYKTQAQPGEKERAARAAKQKL